MALRERALTGSKSRPRTRVRPTTPESSKAINLNPGVVATSSGGGASRPAARVGCGDLSEFLVLMSPDPAVLEGIKPDDKLPVERQGKSIVALSAGEVAGAIVLPEMARLHDCIHKGFKFAFSVASVNGGRCDGVLHCVGKP